MYQNHLHPMQEDRNPSSAASTEDYLSPATSGAIYLKIIIQPRAARESVVGSYQGRLKVKVNAPPVEAAANKNLISVISKLLRAAKGNIIIKQGETSRNKLLLVKGISVDKARGYIGAAITKNKG